MVIEKQNVICKASFEWLILIIKLSGGLQYNCRINFDWFMKKK